MTKRNIVVSEAASVFIEDQPVEIVERKGIGHPDSLCDGIAEAISQAYTDWCVANLGGPLHHNFDKVQLVAGESSPRFGGGDVIKPIRIQIAGRGTPEYNGTKVPMDTIAIQAAKDYVRRTMKYLDPDKHMVIDCFAGRGSSELISQVMQVTANDTSFGVSHWPRSGLEEAVYQTCNYITGQLRDEFPVGEDVKVMGCRIGNDITLTVALPFIASRVADAAEYEEAKRAAQHAIQVFAEKITPDRNVKVMVNTADQAERGNYYLTVTGTSAEMGDDGEVGRGNRASGLITPMRSASLEAPCGKNPISHVGKVYNALALDTCRDIVNRVSEVREVTMQILSQIGHPIDQPLVCNAQVRTKSGVLSDETREAIAAVIDEHLANIADVRTRIRTGEITLF
ncbi:MAG: methionine adenosyltransferase [Candidatus Roseilinea sp.]|uniref:methionine adenosyltransferase n=1 Tax=Candidatus Roseilinea sp. TaxID=2838777 RepID=UPI00404AEE9C